MILIPTTFSNSKSGLLLIVLFLATACVKLPAFHINKVEIISQGKKHIFNVEVMVTRQEKQQGLMFRKSLADNAGMVFIFQPPQFINMWMKNTKIPLDMLFISQGKIVNIKHNSTPMSVEIIPSKYIADMVLELPAGTVKKYNILIGDKVMLQ